MTADMLERIYAWGVIITFVVALIPAWIESDDGGGWFGAPPVERVLCLLVFGTLKAAGFALLWPLAVPIFLIMWWQSR